MMHNERDGRLAGSRLTRFTWRLLAAAWLDLLLLCYTTLAERLTDESAAQAIAFYAAFGLTVLASACLIVRVLRLLATLDAVLRRAPIRLLIFLLNITILGLLLICVAKHWGVILLMLLAAPLLLTCLLVSDRTRLAATDKLVRFSPVSFAVIYACLGLGEVYLRFHPTVVGGGGGGNPALNRMYADLYSFNSFGLRDVEFSETPPKDTYRILAVGDSFTFGQGVKLADTYVKRMEALLNASKIETRYQVINVGRRGADTVWELSWLNEHGMKFHPDLISVQFYINDLAAHQEKNGGLRSSRTETRLQSVPRRIYRAVTNLSQRSYVLFFLRYRLWSLGKSQGRADWRFGLAQDIAADGRGWQECAAALDGLGTFSREVGIPVVMILFPHPGPPHEATKIVHEAVTKRSRQAGLRVIDLAEAFLAVDPADQTVNALDHHPSARNYSIAAVRIVESLRRLGLIPLGPTE